jgi:hypothetical protein
MLQHSTTTDCRKPKEDQHFFHIVDMSTISSHHVRHDKIWNDIQQTYDRMYQKKKGGPGGGTTSKQIISNSRKLVHILPEGQLPFF